MKGFSSFLFALSVAIFATWAYGMETDVANLQVKMYSPRSFVRKSSVLARATVKTFGKEYNLRLKSPGLNQSKFYTAF